MTPRVVTSLDTSPVSPDLVKLLLLLGMLGHSFSPSTSGSRGWTISELETNLVYKLSFSLARATWCDLVLKDFFFFLDFAG